MDVMQIVSRLVEIVGAASLFSAVEDNYRLELVHITFTSFSLPLLASSLLLS
jgi:hypothetical protein